MKELKFFGDICPIPLLKIMKELESIKVGESFLAVVDHSCVVESISDYFKEKPHSIEIDEVMNGVWEIEITKNH